VSVVPGVSYASIKKAVAAEYGVSLEELNSESRKRPKVYARWAAFVLARRLTALSLTQIGMLTGNRDHSTVVFGVDKAEIMLDPADPDFDAHFAGHFEIVSALLQEHLNASKTAA
jgi:chromosomal replication initiation ATPase DnaA